MNKQQELEAKIRELYEEIREQCSHPECGECDGTGYWQAYTSIKVHCKYCNGSGSEPRITLEHVLRCLPNFAYSDVKGFIEFHAQPQHYTRKAVYWQLGKTLNDQSQEVIDLLYPLICTA